MLKSINSKINRKVMKAKKLKQIQFGANYDLKRC